MKPLQPVNLSAEQYLLGCQVMAGLPVPAQRALHRGLGGDRAKVELGTRLQDILYVELEGSTL